MPGRGIYLTVVLLGVVALGLPSAHGPTQAPAPDEVERPDLHHESIVVDAHNDVLSFLVPPYDRFPWENGWDGDFLPVLDLGQDLGSVTRYGHIDLSALREGNLNVPYFAVFSSERFWGDRALEQALGQIYALHHNQNLNADKMDLARTPGDIKDTTDAGRIAAVLTVEGADYITEANGKELLRQLADLGVAVLGLTWNDSNQLAEGLNSIYPDASSSEPGMGLTEFGAEIVQKMNELGIVVDVSHLHENSFWDVLEVSDESVIASHSSAAAVHDHPRNLTDEQIEAIAAGGGVGHIAFVPSFLASDPDQASVQKVVDHIDHVVQLVGVEHVGLGSDFDGAVMPSDLSGASDLPRVTEELLGRGYTAEDVRLILGENALRVLSEVQERAQNQKLHDAWIHMGPSMGERFSNSPQLRAAVHGGPASGPAGGRIRVIVDGQEVDLNVLKQRYQLRSDMWGITVSADPQDLLSGGFHVITVELSGEAGRVQRETRIIHVGR